MTVVVAINNLTEIILVADTRVSYEGRYINPLYGAHKIVTFKYDELPIVLAFGFSGNVIGAGIILDYVLNKKLKNYRRRLVVEHLKEDIRKWIQEAVTIYTIKRTASTPTFIFCAFDLYKRGGFEEMGLSQGHMYIYKILSEYETEVKMQSRISMIGSGREEEAYITQVILSIFSRPMDIPNFNYLPMYPLQEEISDRFQKLKSILVGGPFEIVRLVPFQDTNYFLFPGEDTIVTYESNKALVKNRKTNKVFTIVPPYAWKQEAKDYYSVE